MEPTPNQKMPGKTQNTRLIAVAIAVMCMLVDDLPEAGYNTFHDPGAAAMLSIIFADLLALIIRRGWWVVALLAFLPMLFLKAFIQPVFWIHGAELVDTGTLMAAHVLLGFLAVRGGPIRIRLRSAFRASAVVTVTFVIICIIGSAFSWIGEYVALGAVRVLVPCAFWTVVFFVERQGVPIKSSGASSVEV